MNLSLNAIASIVINSTFAGLKSKTNIPLSVDQVKDEIATLRSRIIHEMIEAGKTDFEGLYIKIPCVSLVCRDMGECCDVPTGTMALSAKVPKIYSALMNNKKAFRYVGSPNMFLPFKILTGNDHIYSQYDRFTGQKPAAYFDDNSNVWLINPPSEEMDVLSMTIIPENPKDLEMYSCCAVGDDDPYPVPGWMIDSITGKLINDYIRYYRSLMPAQPNQMSANDVIPGGGQQ